MGERYFIKMVADIAVILGLIPEGLLKGVGDKFGIDSKRISDISNINLSAIYLMQDIPNGCKANCSFCVQSVSSNSERRKSSLIDNPLLKYPFKPLLKKIENGLLDEKNISRICIQTVYNKETIPNLIDMLQAFRSVTSIPITACCIPASFKQLTALKEAGLDIITINYEAATPEIFDNIRGKKAGGPYRWHIVSESIDNALEIFGKQNVGSHLQLGFGETDRDSFSHIQTLHNKGVFVSLFVFQPVPGTKLENSERISHQSFHKIQLGSYIIQNNIGTIMDFNFNNNGTLIDYGISRHELDKIIGEGKPFRNKGCPGCNRLYYDTNPNERFYTYPRPLEQHELSIIKKEIYG